MLTGIVITLFCVAFVCYAYGVFKSAENVPQDPPSAPVQTEREPWADHAVTCRCIFHR